MKQFKVVSLYFFLIVNLFSGLGVNAKSIIAADIVEGQQYVPNFLKQKGHFEKNANGISAYADAAGTRPVNGSGGAPTLSCTRTTSSPIDGDGSLLITKDAANRQGQGCSIQFTIDSAYKAKVLQIEFDYLLASGTFTAGSSSADSDIIAYLYDVTNSTLIEPSSIKLLSNSTTIADHFVANFQTSATGTTYNLILHQATTSASAYTIKADNIQVKPSQYVYGTPITDWTSYTPTGSWTTNTTYTGRWRRVGDTLESQINLVLAGAPTAADLTVNFLPSGLTVDTAKMAAFSFGSIGDANIIDSGSRVYIANPAYNGGSSVYIVHTESGNGGVVNATNPTTFASADNVRINIRVPITGWSSSTQQSDGYDGRLISFAASKTVDSSAFAAATDTAIAFTNVLKDSTNSWNGTDTYTVPSAGDYHVSVNLYWGTGASTTSTQGKIFVDGALYAIPSVVTCSASATSSNSFSLTIPNLRAGQTIKVYGWVNAGSASIVYGNGNKTATLNIEKLQAPTTMSATARVSGLRNSTSGQSISANTETTIQYANSEEDTHGMWSTSTHDWTVPVAGSYSVNGFLRTTGVETVTAGQIFRVKLYVDGSYAKEVSFIRYLNTVAGSEQAANFSGELKLNAGQKVSIVLLSTVACTLSNAAGVNWAAIRLIK